MEHKHTLLEDEKRRFINKWVTLSTSWATMDKCEYSLVFIWLQTICVHYLSCLLLWDLVLTEEHILQRDAVVNICTWERWETFLVEKDREEIKTGKTTFRWENNMMVVLKDVGSDWISQAWGIGSNYRLLWTMYLEAS